jgi:hypothetical protein
LLADRIGSAIIGVSAVYYAVTVIINPVGAQTNFILCCWYAYCGVHTHAFIFATLPVAV